MKTTTTNENKTAIIKYQKTKNKTESKHNQHKKTHKNQTNEHIKPTT